MEGNNSASLEKRLERYDKKIEEELVEQWEKEALYRFVDDGKAPVYVIDSPPPFTSGKLHMGHILSFTMFDIVARFKRMSGYHVLYAQGWDTQGFPTEVKVERKYGRLPREQFIEKCHEWTREYMEYMRQQAKRFGFSADWTREYATLKPEYHKKVQLSLIEMYKKGDVYTAEHPVYWCPHCHSALAKAELEEAEKEGTLWDLRFEVEGKPLVVATTRPELLHAVVAVAVHPDDERYKNLIGKTVKTPLGKEVPLIADKDVDMEFGTGVVMIATFGDKQDVVWMYRHKLPYIKAMDENGRLINAGEFNGLKVDEAKKAVIEKLKAEGKVLGEKKLKQVVKIHDRCKRPVELLMSKQWFAKLLPYKDEIKKAAQEIEWHPDFGIYYLLDWLNTLEWDWVISRQRYFGTPLPFYVCPKCGHTVAADEDELPFYPENAKPKKCPKCGAEMKPEEAVADCWVDSSITPLIVARWPEDGWKKYYPSDLRPQGIEIVRTWAFYTIYRGLRLTGEKPFKHVLLHGHVMGPDGKKMSKSLGNVVDPKELLEKYSADAIRLWVAFSGSLEKDRPFKYDQVKRMQSLVNKIWNASRFVEMVTEDYEGENEEKEEGKEKIELTPTDKWILSRLNKVMEEYVPAMEEFDFYKAVTALTNFFWGEFCDNYLEFVKYRVYNDVSKKAAQKTLKTVLKAVLKLYAPFAPFATDYIYRHMFGKTLHKGPMPDKQSFVFDEKSMKWGSDLKGVAELIRKKKKELNLSMKAALEEIELNGEGMSEDEKEYLENEMKSIFNVEHVKWVVSTDKTNKDEHAEKP